MDKYAMPWTVIADRDNGKVRRNPYGITFFPTLLLLGPDGRILEKGWNLRGAELENVLRRYMPDAPGGERMIPDDNWRDRLFPLFV